MIDAHVHLWDPEVLTYEWLEGTPVRRPMLPEHYEADAPGVRGAVFVQAADGDTDPVAEARWVEGLEWPSLRAIVAGADLAAPLSAVTDQLDALATLPHVSGIRHLLQDLDVATFPALVPGLTALAARGGTFDACLRHAQLPALISMLRDVPDLTVVVDHVAKPPMDAGIDSPAGAAWAQSLAVLAARPRTFVKLSGLTPEAREFDEVERHAAGFLAHAVEVFGPERSMIASDWPVSSTFGAAGSFAEWVERVRAVVPAEGWDDVAEATALRAYLPGGEPALARRA